MEKSLYQIDFSISGNVLLLDFYSPQFIISTSTSLALKNFIEETEKYIKGNYEILDLKINKIVDIKNIIEEKL